ncbi:hypothetical protein WICMUC_003533 [Wickerhamomyces mucosus]|uniref:Uncharacterized protein n=1 Tax=Wickerhamomyces mucosus TaxID=1378264 RepID=A0A9P8PL87_9ASCO|nr:hypothetical protein WICMUC_003533 [Wickerhamomyces mucosus]
MSPTAQIARGSISGSFRRSYNGQKKGLRCSICHKFSHTESECWFKKSNRSKPSTGSTGSGTGASSYVPKDSTSEKIKVKWDQEMDFFIKSMEQNGMIAKTYSLDDIAIQHERLIPTVWIKRLISQTLESNPTYYVSLFARENEESKPLTESEINLKGKKMIGVRALFNSIVEKGWYQMAVLDVQKLRNQFKLDKRVFCKVDLQKVSIVCEVVGMLPGLKESDEKWKTFIDVKLDFMNFERSTQIRDLYIRKFPGSYEYIIRYDDELLIIGKDISSMIYGFESVLGQENIQYKSLYSQESFNIDDLQIHRTLDENGYTKSIRIDQFDYIKTFEQELQISHLARSALPKLWDKSIISLTPDIENFSTLTPTATTSDPVSPVLAEFILQNALKLQYLAKITRPDLLFTAENLIRLLNSTKESLFFQLMDHFTLNLKYLFSSAHKQIHIEGTQKADIDGADVEEDRSFWPLGLQIYVSSTRNDQNDEDFGKQLCFYGGIAIYYQNIGLLFARSLHKVENTYNYSELDLLEEAYHEVQKLLYVLEEINPDRVLLIDLNLNSTKFYGELNEKLHSEIELHRSSAQLFLDQVIDNPNVDIFIYSESDNPTQLLVSNSSNFLSLAHRLTVTPPGT